MKHSVSIHHRVLSLQERYKKEYYELLSTKQLSLIDLLSPEKFDLPELCSSFNPHPQSAELLIKTKVFGDQYKIWTQHAESNITCALFLYPYGRFDRVAAIMKNMLLDFFLNDIMGRDVYKHRVEEISEIVIKNISHVKIDLSDSTPANLIEAANIEALMDFKNNSPKAWFQKFLKQFTHHIEITHRDLSAETTGRIQTINNYIERRCHYSGMNHVVTWMEYAEGEFLNWHLLRKAKLSEKLKKAQHAVAAWGGLSNDFFSFEKEVINNAADSNLIMMVALNAEDISLLDAFTKASVLMRTFLNDAIDLIEELRKDTAVLKNINAAEGNKLLRHLDALTTCIQASWEWQAQTKRYQRAQSIWRETQIMESVIK